MKKRRRVHIPVFIWFLLSVFFFYNFTTDKNNGGLHLKKANTSFEKYLDSLYATCKLAEANLNKTVFEKALTGYLNIESSNKSSLKKPILSIIDFSKKSTEKRLWVVNLEIGKLLYHTLVAHGKNTGEQYATQFSNDISSNMSSLGFYIAAEIYQGKHGTSLALDGLEKGINNNARQRSVVMHAADYVSEDFIRNVGRIGRSLGCPALPAEIAPEIIHNIAGGSCLFIYFPDARYLNTSYYANFHQGADINSTKN